MPAVTPVETAKVLAALKMGASFDWNGAIAAFESQTTQDKILNGMMAAEEVSRIVGLFFPPAAVIASDIGIAIEVEPFVFQAVSWISEQPLPKRIAGQVVTWGSRVTTSAASTITSTTGLVSSAVTKTVGGILKTLVRR